MMSDERNPVPVISTPRTITQDDLDEFARISGDNNPIHVDAAYAATTPFEKPVAHGMFLFSLVRAELRKHWPDSWVSEQQLQFLAPTPIGSVVTVRISEVAKSSHSLQLATEVTSQDGAIGLTGHCTLSSSHGGQA